MLLMLRTVMRLSEHAFMNLMFMYGELLFKKNYIQILTDVLNFK